MAVKMTIFRLTEHFVLDEDGFLPAEEIYQTFQINAIDRKKEINFNSFCKILQNVFRTERKRKIIDGKKQTVYPVKWRVLDKTKDVLNTEELVQLLMTHGRVTCSDENNITLARSTGFLSNNNVIHKDVMLLSETFEVQLRGIVVDLSEYEISGEYHRSKDGILALIQQIDAIPICQGTVIKKRKYEMHKNLICERLSRENERDHFTEIFRSANCRQAATLSGRSYPNCRTCQRLVVHYKEPIPTRQTLEKNLQGVLVRMPNGKKKKTKSRPTSGAQADLEDSGLEQSDYELSGVEQSDYELSGAEQSDYELSGAEQIDHELSGVEQSDNQLSGAEQSDNQLSGAEQSDDQLSGADQSDHELSGAEQSDDQLSGAEQSDDQLSGADQSDHELSGAEQSDDQLSGAEQSDDQLSGADQSDHELSGAEHLYEELLGAEQSDDQLSGADQSDHELSGAEQTDDYLSGGEQSDQAEQSDLEQLGAKQSDTKGFGPTASLEPKHVAEQVKRLQGPATVPRFEELLSSEAIGEGTVKERKREFLSRLAAFTERIYKPDGRVNYCKICKKTYVTDHNFDVHLAAMHSKVKKFNCINCNKNFGLERQLKRHQEYHCQAAYKCHFCLKSFFSTKELDEHKLMTHKKGKIEKCEICGQGFTTKRFLKSHKRIHSSETPFQCTVTGCEKSFQTKILRERHVDKIHRTKEADFRHKCKGCKKKFQTQFDLMVHRKKHKGDESHPEHIFRKPFLYKCPDCGKEIKYPQLVKPHREIHTQSLKPMMERAPKKVQIKSDDGHICKFCNTNLRSAKELLGHVRFVHSVYKCFHCIQEFNSDQARQVHLRKEHYKTEVKEPRKPKTSWPCKHCDLMFSSSSRHDEHVMTMHKGFRCKKCDIVFPSKYAIVKHRRLMHRKPQDTTGVKIYKCSDCSEVFQTLFLKRKHRKIMHPRLGTQGFNSENGRKTDCQVCGRSCASEWHLGEHMKTHSSK